MQTLVVDDHVLFWYRNRFYRANQFAAAYAVIPVQDRSEVLSEANTTFQSLAMSKQDVYADILSYVDNILRPLTEAKDTEGGRRPLPATKQRNPDYTRSSRPGYGSHQGPRMDTVSRNGTTITTNGLTRSGKIGDDAIKVTSTEIASGLLAIAEASRSGSSRLMDSSSSGAS